MVKPGAMTALMSAMACWLLVGCATKQSESQEHNLTADSRLRVAEAAESSGNRDMAIAMFSGAAEAAPNNTSMQLQCAEGLARNGKLGDASALLARRLKADPHDLDLLRTLGGVQVLDGHEEQAVQTLSVVLAARPADLKAMVNKAVALDVLRRHEDAQTLYRQALQQAPSDPAISSDLALSLMLSGKTDEARQTLEPFRDVSGLPQRIKINLGILDAIDGRSGLAGSEAESRIAEADLIRLTDAIRHGDSVAPSRP